MTTRKAAHRKNHPTSIPVRVVPSAPLPTADPVQQSAALKRVRSVPQPVTPVAPASKKVFPVKPSAQAAVPSMYQWPEAKRRKFLWAVVGVASLGMVTGWLFLVSDRFGRPHSEQLVTDITQLFSGLKNATPPPSPAEKQIRQLDQQVFPQFKTQE